MPNWLKFHEDSVELDHIALAALELELKPRKPVHLSMQQTLGFRCWFNVEMVNGHFDTVPESNCSKDKHFHNANDRATKKTSKNTTNIS